MNKTFEEFSTPSACAIADAAYVASSSQSSPENVCSFNLYSNPYKSDFLLLDSHPELSFLDSAATAQRPRSVIDAQKRFYETMNANALRGLYRLSVEATEAIGLARQRVARFIGAADFHDIIFTRNASESLNLVAKAFGAEVLRPGDEVCISIMEHHSNLIPWQMLCRERGAKLVYLYPDKNGNIDDSQIEEKIGPRTKIVSIVHVSNVLGIENPVKKIADYAHLQGAYVVVDGAQSVPHMKLDVEDLHVDFFAFSAHKVFGPFGIGILWGKNDLLESMPPFLTGGEMISSVTEQDSQWAEVPEKFEAGTQDAAGIYATAAALAYTEAIGFDAISQRESALVADCMDKLAALPFIELIGSPDPAYHHGVISFNVSGIHPHDVSSILDTYNVAIRAGHHCAQPLLNWYGISSCCRASYAFYNDARDTDRFIEGLKGVWRTFNG